MLNEELEVMADDGVVMRARVVGKENATRLVMSHGNGLAIGGYEAYWSQLTDEFQVVLFDFRGHGLSDSGTIENHNWRQFERDFDTVLASIEEVLGERKTFGAFHSLSAILSLRHARAFKPRWSGLLLFDPPIIPPDGHPLQAAHIAEMLGLADRVRNRLDVFESTQQLANQFRRAPAFSRWLPEAFDDMAEAVLRKSSQNGQWNLSCAPAYEAKIFESNNDTSLWSWLPQATVPLKLVCADPGLADVQPSAHIGRAAAHEFGLDYEYIEETTHFLQVERPDVCARITRQFCAGNR